MAYRLWQGRKAGGDGEMGRYKDDKRVMVMVYGDGHVESRISPRSLLSKVCSNNVLKSWSGV